MSYLSKPNKFGHGVSQTYNTQQSKFGSYADRWQPPRKTDRFTEPGYITIYFGNYEMPVEYQDERGQWVQGVAENNWYEYFRHYIPFMGRNGQYRNCSAGMIAYRNQQGKRAYKIGNQPCELCNDQRVDAPRLLQLINVVVWGAQHRLEETVDNRTQTSWAPCEADGGYQCKYCAKGLDIVHARRAYWPARVKDMRVLEDVMDRKVYTACADCEAQALVIGGASCERCNHLFMVLDQTPMSKSDVYNYFRSIVTCPACQHEGYPQEVQECSKCGCDSTKQPENVRLTVLQTNTGTDSTPRWDLMIDDIGFLTVEEKELMASVVDPFDFAQMEAPMSLEDQLKILNPANQNSAPRSASGNWSNQQQQRPAGPVQTGHAVDYNQTPGNGGRANPPRPPASYFGNPGHSTGQR